MEGEIQVGGLLNSAPNIYKFGRFVAKPSPWTEGDPTVAIDHLPHADLTSSPKTYRSSPATGQHAWAGNFALPHPPQTGRGRDGRGL